MDTATRGINHVLERWSQAASGYEYNTDVCRQTEHLSELQTESTRAARDENRGHNEVVVLWQEIKNIKTTSSALKY